MKVLDLLDEIVEICDSSNSMPIFSNRIVIDKQEMLEIVGDIRNALPDEIQQAQFIKNERTRILDEAKQEYEILIKDAEKQRDILTDNHEITQAARARASEIEAEAEKNAMELKMYTYEYIDKLLYDIQQSVDTMNNKYIEEMYREARGALSDVTDKLSQNRSEIKELAYRLNPQGQ
jgi:hypothetical protein